MNWWQLNNNLIYASSIARYLDFDYMTELQNKMEHPFPLQLPLIKNHFFDTVANIPTFKKILSHFTKFQYVTQLLFYIDNKKVKNESPCEPR